MSSYSRLIIIFIFIFSGCVNAQPSLKVNNQNDTLILLALDYELSKKFNKSAELYLRLYRLTDRLEYLQKAINQSILAKDFKTSGILCKENLDKYPKKDERFHRLAVISSLHQLKLNEALELAKKLLKKYNNTENYEIIGNVYYARGEYIDAVKYFESAYAINQKPKTLVSLADVLYVYLNEKQKAISYLETFMRLYGCKQLVCNKLIELYQEEQNIDGMISILKTAYKKYKNPFARYKISVLLVNNLEKKDINQAIKFLEKNRIDDTKLLILYEKAGYYKKALKLVRNAYKKTKNKALLGKIAILEFEIAEDKKAMMKHVFANFELALTVTEDANYKNYYGYLLIDYDINVSKGLELAKQALDKHPNNAAYLDSVAWGYFKLGKCDLALKYMKKVIEQIGLDNKEIKLHWEKIQECKK